MQGAVVLNPAGPLIPSTLPAIPTTPNYEKDHIFEIFEKYANNFLIEVFGRHMWCTGRLDLPRGAYMVRDAKNKRRAAEGKPEKTTIKLFVNSIAPTVCQVTEEGLMASLFGPKWEASSPENIFNLDPNAEKGVSSLKAILNAHEPASLHQKFRYLQSFIWTTYSTLDQNNWNAYRIGIGGGLGHALVLIQAFENNKIAYRVFQSFVEKYTLQDYLKQNNNTFSLSEVNLMLDEILEYVSSKNWTKGTEHLYTHFFKAKLDFTIGDEIPYKRFLRIKWGNVNRQAMKVYAQDYQKAFPAELKFKM